MSKYAVKSSSKRLFLRYLVGGSSSLFIPTRALSSASLSSPRKAIETDILDHLAKRMVKELVITIPAGSETNVKAIAELFTSLSGVKVRLNIKPVDVIDDYLLLATQGGSYTGDLALPATFALPDLIKTQSILDLTALQRKYSNHKIEQGMLYKKGESHQGKFYGHQTDGDTYLMYFNKRFYQGDLAKGYEQKYGKAITIPKNWPELDEQIKYFHRPQDDIYGGILFRNSNYVVWEWWLRFHAKGGLPLSNQAKPLINSEAGQEALEDMVKITKFMPKSVFENGLFDNWKAYSNGNIYCNIGWGGTQKYLREHNQNLEHGVLITPPLTDNNKKGIKNIGYFNWGWNYTIPISSKEPELAYLFSLLAVGPETSNLAVRQPGFFDPFRKEHYEDPAIKNIYGEQFLTAHRQAMSNSIPDFYMSNQGEYFDILRASLLNAIHNRRTVKESLDSAAKQWQIINNRIGRGAVTQQWLELLNSYPNMYKAGMDS